MFHLFLFDTAMFSFHWIVPVYLARLLVCKWAQLNISYLTLVNNLFVFKQELWNIPNIYSISEKRHWHVLDHRNLQRNNSQELKCCSFAIKHFCYQTILKFYFIVHIGSYGLVSYHFAFCIELTLPGITKLKKNHWKLHYVLFNEIHICIFAFQFNRIFNYWHLMWEKKIMQNETHPLP